MPATITSFAETDPRPTPHLNALVPQAMRECSPARNSDPAAINGYWSRRWIEVSQLGAPRHVGAPNRLDVFLGGLRRESLARTGMVPGELGPCWTG